jgi:hypothetical protein
MHHTVAWRLSSADATATDLTPVPDQIIAIQNGHFMPTRDYLLQFAYAGAASINRARFISPTFRQISTPWIRPVNSAIVPLDEPNVSDYRLNPLSVRKLEELQLEGTQTSGGAAVIVGVAGLSLGPVTPAPQGDPYTMRGTGASTLVACAWTLVAVTWQDSLPSGRYACTGFEAIGATMLSSRLVFEDQWARPGTLGQSLATGQNHRMFTRGGLGVWGQFDANRMPTVECLANAADTAQEFYLELVRIG